MRSIASYERVPRFKVYLIDKGYNPARAYS